MLLVEVTMLWVHDLFSCPHRNGFSSFSFFTQLTEVTGLPLIRSSNFARCSSGSLAKASGGTDGRPLVAMVMVDSHSPGFTSSGWKSAAQIIVQHARASPSEIFVIKSTSVSIIYATRRRETAHAIPPADIRKLSIRANSKKPRDGALAMKLLKCRRAGVSRKSGRLTCREWNACAICCRAR